MSTYTRMNMYACQLEALLKEKRGVRSEKHQVLKPASHRNNSMGNAMCGEPRFVGLQPFPGHSPGKGLQTYKVSPVTILRFWNFRVRVRHATYDLAPRHDVEVTPW